MRLQTKPVWSLVRTKRGKEFMAHRELARVALEVFLPVLRTRQPRGGRGSAPVPLFSNHLFARLDPTRSQLAVKYCRGVSALVLNGDTPLLVPAGIIELLRQLVAVREDGEPAEPTAEAWVDREARSELESLFAEPLTAEERLVVLFRAIEAARAIG